MKKNIGIVRNKYSQLVEVKKKLQRKKNRFQISSNKEYDGLGDETGRSQDLLTSTSINSTSEQQINYNEVYQKAKERLRLVDEIQKKISIQSKARLTSFKEKENQKYDENISKLASEATNHLMQAEKFLKLISAIVANKCSEEKFLENMKKSLALQIREVSRSLRQQEKQYFDTIRMYQKNITNGALVLSKEQKQIMLSAQCEEMQEQKNDSSNKKIDDLVKSINKLSGIYKELNNLVIEQGSLVDRIDVNIESTLDHTKSAVNHLEAADQAASSPFADKVIKVLVISIILMAIFLGLKYSA